MAPEAAPGVPGPPFDRARIHGAGLPGLSLAVAMRARGAAARIELVDPNPGARARAVALGFPAESRASLFSTTPELVILATTPRANEQLLPQVAREYPLALITDIASVKRSITAIAAGLGLAGLRFVGSHPLVSTGSGDNADAGLFVGAPVAICPQPESPNPVVASIERLWQLLGGRPVLLSAEDHDRTQALTTHLPAVTAFALARVSEPAVLPGAAGEHLVGPGFRDSTRLAAGAPELWPEVLTRNADSIVPGLRDLAANLTAVADYLESNAGPRGTAADDRDPPDDLTTWLESASRFRHQMEGE